MTTFRMAFAGDIKKADHKEVGGKKLVEVSLCKKNRGRPGEEDTFTWLRVAIWEPADFQLPKLVKGAFIGGTGEVMLRSFQGKEGKQTSLEARCSSFDIEVADGAPRAAEAPARASLADLQIRTARAPAPISGGDDEPPF
jgi:single-stranded DNA-binding protein